MDLPTMKLQEVLDQISANEENVGTVDGEVVEDFAEDDDFYEAYGLLEECFVAFLALDEHLMLVPAKDRDKLETLRDEVAKFLSSYDNNREEG